MFPNVLAAFAGYYRPLVRLVFALCSHGLREHLGDRSNSASSDRRRLAAWRCIDVGVPPIELTHIRRRFIAFVLASPRERRTRMFAAIATKQLCDSRNHGNSRRKSFHASRCNGHVIHSGGPSIGGEKGSRRCWKRPGARCARPDTIAFRRGVLGLAIVLSWRGLKCVGASVRTCRLTPIFALEEIHPPGVSIRLSGVPQITVDSTCAILRRM